MKFSKPALIFLLLTAGLTQAAEINLPEMGSSAAEILTPEEEDRYGRQMFYEYRRLGYVIDDPMLADYIEALGYRLVAHSERPEQDFTFFIVRSNDINAFAAPGGFVGVNAGLMYLARREDELAAVMGHEVAHVTQRHLVRAYEKMQKSTLPIALAMLGALVATRNTSGDATQAILASGMGAIQQQQINFTRHNEYEADRIGIGILYRTGFAPVAAADFFKRLANESRANGEGPPPYLRTHPVTITRVSEAHERADRLMEETPVTESIYRPDDANFALMKHRARVLSADAPGALIADYRRELKNTDEASRQSLQYGLGIALSLGAEHEEALRILGALADASPGQLPFEIALAEARLANRQHAEAARRLAPLVEQFPDSAPLKIAFAGALTASAEKAKGRQAAEVLRPLINKRGYDPTLQLAFARANELSGDEDRALEAHAEVALYTGRPFDAMEQLKRLLERPSISYYQRARVEARVAEITPFILELERRRMHPETDQRLGLSVNNGM
ncbi:MAG: M48 family metallopeptidase [Ahniella sp.]|nr:M48 family metallopeptidase [Ahniella sp.]